MIKITLNSLKTKNVREAEVLAKQHYKDIFDKIRSGEIVKKDFDFTRDIANPYFRMRIKKFKN